MIKIKAAQLIHIENGQVILDRLNLEISKFLDHPWNDPLLKFDIQTILGGKIIQKINDILHFRMELIKQYPEPVAPKAGAAKGKNAKIIEEKLIDLLNSEIEIEANPVRISRLVNESCPDLNFFYLKPFLEDDRCQQ